MSLQVWSLAERHVTVVTLVLSNAIMSLLMFLEIAYLAEANVATRKFTPIGLLFCVSSEMSEEFPYALYHPVTFMASLLICETALK